MEAVGAVHIKPDPGPSSVVPSWLTGGPAASGSNAASQSTGSVPHRDFGMSPNSPLRRGSDPSSSHAAALAAIHRRGSSQSTAGAQQGQASRWATTVRNQLHRIERDGLRKTFWSRGRQLGSGNAASSSGAPTTSAVGRAWDRLRRIPDLLFVESEDPVDGLGAVWANADTAAAGEAESSDTSDLFDEQDEKGATRSAASRKQLARRRSSAAPLTPVQKLSRAVNRLRKSLGISKGSFLLLLLLLLLGLYELMSPAQSSRNAGRKLGRLRVYPRKPFKTLSDAGILLSSAPTRILDAKASQAVPPIGVNPATLETALAPMRQMAKTTAVLLNWKRTENLVVIVAHLCAYSGAIFDSVQVWNNNPEVILTQEVSLLVRLSLTLVDMPWVDLCGSAMPEEQASNIQLARQSAVHGSLHGLCSSRHTIRQYLIYSQAALLTDWNSVTFKTMTGWSLVYLPCTRTFCGIPKGLP